MTELVSAEALQAFRLLLTRQLGLEVSTERPLLLEQTLLSRARQRRETVDQYIQRLASDTANEELPQLASELTVTESYFFRDAHQFQVLRDVVIPTLRVELAATRRVRVLSAGCAAGEEPYSLLITLFEQLGPEWTIAISAIDVNRAALQRARRACYSAWALRDTPGSARSRWFELVGREYRLRTETLPTVQFTEMNLSVDLPGMLPVGAFELVFCRNALMYFTPEKSRALKRRLIDAMVPRAFLFLGHAETLSDLPGSLRVCNSHGTFYYRKGGDLPGAHPALCTPGVPAVSPSASFEASGGATQWFEDITQAAARVAVLAERHAVEPRAAQAVRGLEGQWAPPSPRVEPSRISARVLALIGADRFGEALELLGETETEETGGELGVLRAAVLVHLGKLSAAESCCAQLLESGADDASLHYLLALCSEPNDVARARLHYRRAAELDPEFAMPRLQLGLLERRRGDAHAARASLLAARTLLDDESEARLLLFGGGFGRAALIALCASELAAC